jgi:hypothetical protein
VKQVAGARYDKSRFEISGEFGEARGMYVDCGWRNQYRLKYGSRILSRRLAKAGIRYLHGEFDDDQSDIDYRMEINLPVLFRALR